MKYPKRLGIMVKEPSPGRVKKRLVPPLSDEQAARLSLAFLADTAARISKLKKVSVTVFFAGDPSGEVRALLPLNWGLERQEGKDLGERMLAAFRLLLDGEGSAALLIGTDSPDLPLKYIKRAFMKLKHKDVVIGPCADGGYYLIGLRRLVPELFAGVAWGTPGVFEETLARAEEAGLSLSLLPLWYDVDDLSSLDLLRAMAYGKRLEGSTRLVNVERVLREIDGENR